MLRDKRVGIIHEDRIEHPEVDIYGNQYVRPAGITAGVGRNRFVVLPFGFVDDGTLAGLRGEFTPSHMTGKSKRQVADETPSEVSGDEAGE